MSDMKCPICQSNLHKINIIVSTCTNDKCKLWGSSIPNLVLDALAQAKQDLKRTRKALDVAKDTIRHTDWFFDGDYNVDAKTMHNEIRCAIKGITALEQKE